MKVVAAACAAILLVLALVRVPYMARETYFEVESRPVQKIVEDRSSPVYARVCEQAAGRFTITEHKYYIAPYGLKDYKCYSEFRVTNQEDQDYELGYKYVFTVAGRDFETDEKTYLIPKLSSIRFKFELDGCKSGDTLAGRYAATSTPRIEKCSYQTTYLNKTVASAEEIRIEKERIVRKYEPLYVRLWQLILGANS